MKMTEKQMFDYMFCPALYEMKHERGINVPDHRSLKSLLSQVTNHFYTNLLNEKVCSVDELKRKWDSVCEANKDIIDAKKNLAGIGLIVNLHQYASENKMVVLDFNTKFNLMVGEVEIEGIINDPILAVENNNMELFVANFSGRVPDNMSIDMDTKYTLELYAFNKLYEKQLDGINVYLAKKNENVFSNRNHIDYKRLETTISNIGKGIKNKIFYPREQILCNNCDARHYCKYWHL